MASLQMISTVWIIIFATILGILGFTINGKIKEIDKNYIFSELTYYAVAAATWAILIKFFAGSFIKDFWLFKTQGFDFSYVEVEDIVNVIAVLGGLWAPQIFRFLKKELPRYFVKIIGKIKVKRQ